MIRQEHHSRSKCNRQRTSTALRGSNNQRVYEGALVVATSPRIRIDVQTEYIMTTKS